MFLSCLFMWVTVLCDLTAPGFNNRGLERVKYIYIYIGLQLHERKLSWMCDVWCKNVLSWFQTLVEPVGATLSVWGGKKSQVGGEKRYQEQRQNKTIWSGRCATFHSFSTSSWLSPLLSISSTYGSWNMTNDGTLCNPYKEQIIVRD